ncbi:hypothetical protein KAR91_76620 [Candidatus Pacearchaeota archaeon]|nr:hypothetical protein [Candidatus Pacearchaeota archaeon]
MIQSHRPDWVPGGRIGTHGKYTDGHERTFGEQDIFKNLAEEGENYVGVATDRFPGMEETDESQRTDKEGCE